MRKFEKGKRYGENAVKYGRKSDSRSIKDRGASPGIYK